MSSRVSSSSPSGTAGGRRCAGPLVGAGVGDHHLLGGGQQRVQHQLPVLGAGITFTDSGFPGQHVVAVLPGGAWEDPVVHAQQADHPVRHRPHRHHGAHGEGAGAEVRPGRPAGQPAGEQRPDVGPARAKCVPHRPASRSPATVGELAAQFRGLPAVGRGNAGQAVDRDEQRRQPIARRVAAAERIQRGGEPGQQFGEPTGQIDIRAADVIQRQGGVQPVVVLLGHRHAEQDPVEPSAPGVLPECRPARTPAGVRHPAPSGRRIHGPAGQSLQFVVVEPESPAHRRPGRQVEHLRRR